MRLAASHISLHETVVRYDLQLGTSRAKAKVFEVPLEFLSLIQTGAPTRT